MANGESIQDLDEWLSRLDNLQRVILLSLFNILICTFKRFGVKNPVSRTQVAYPFKFKFGETYEEES